MLKGMRQHLATEKERERESLKRLKDALQGRLLAELLLIFLVLFCLFWLLPVHYQQINSANFLIKKWVPETQREKKGRDLLSSYRQYI